MNFNFNDAFSILKKLVSINSSVLGSNKVIIFYIERLLKKYSSKIYQFKKGDLDLYNLIVKIKGENTDKSLVFFMHTDTVVASERWTHEPFKLIIQKDKMYGLGVSDMKASLASVMSALLNLKKKPRNNVIVIFDSDEEGELVGGKYALMELKKENLNQAMIIVPEPTSGKLYLGHKACIDLKVICSGRARHAARTCLDNNLHNNAIYKATKIINELINDEMRLEKAKVTELGSSTQSINMIQGGTGVNVVADQCHFLMTRRLLPQLNLNQEYKQLLAKIHGADKSAQIDTLFKENGFQISNDNLLVKKVEEVVKNNLGRAEFGYLDGWAESGFLQELGDCLIIGPGVEGQGHQSNEYASFSLLNKFTKIWQDLMLS